MGVNNFKIVENIGVILFMTLFAVLGIHMFPLLLLLFPMVFIVFGVKNGLIPSLLNMIIVTLAVGAIVDIYSGAVLFISFAPIAMLTAYGIKNRRKPIEIIGYSALGFFLTSLIVFGYLGKISGVTIEVQLRESFKNVLSIQGDLLKDLGLSDYEIFKTKSLLATFYNSVIMVLPSILIIMSLLASYLNYFLATLNLRKIGIVTVNIPRFSRFRLPNNIITGIFVMFLSIMLIKYLKMSNFDAVLVNLVVLISFMFMTQGLSIIDFYLLKSKMHFIFRLVIIISLVFIPPLVSIITILGLVDTLFDLRKLKKQRS